MSKKVYILKCDKFLQAFLILKWRNNQNSSDSLTNPLIAKSRKQFNTSFAVVYTNRCVLMYVYLFLHYSNRDMRYHKNRRPYKIIHFSFENPLAD